MRNLGRFPIGTLPTVVLAFIDREQPDNPRQPTSIKVQLIDPDDVQTEYTSSGFPGMFVRSGMTWKFKWPSHTKHGTWLLRAKAMDILDVSDEAEAVWYKSRFSNL